MGMPGAAIWDGPLLATDRSHVWAKTCGEKIAARKVESQEKFLRGACGPLCSPFSWSRSGEGDAVPAGSGKEFVPFGAGRKAGPARGAVPVKPYAVPRPASEMPR